jgi:rhomboid family GlyGly-CTERM serine protease
VIGSAQNRAGRRSGVSLALALATLAVFFVPGWNEVLQLDRRGIAAGKFWLLITGHFTHWNLDHLTWDLMTFGILAAFCESRSRQRFLLCLGLSTVAISLGFLCDETALESYRGLSGLDSALYGLAMAEFFHLGRVDQRPMPCVIAVLGVLGFIGKTLLELAAGDTLFVASGGFVPLPGAHLLGFLCGLTTAIPLAFRFPSPRGHAIRLPEGRRAGGGHRWKRA